MSFLSHVWHLLQVPSIIFTVLFGFPIALLAYDQGALHLFAPTYAVLLVSLVLQQPLPHEDHEDHEDREDCELENFYIPEEIIVNHKRFIKDRTSFVPLENYASNFARIGRPKKLTEEDALFDAHFNRVPEKSDRNNNDKEE